MSEPAAQAATETPAAPPTGRKADIVEQFKAIEAAQPKEPETPSSPGQAADGEPPPARERAKTNEGAVTPDERKAWRAEKKDWRERTAKREHELAQKAAELAAKESQFITTGKLKELWEAGHLDELAKMIGAPSYKDFNDYNVKQWADPGYRREQQMRAELDELKASKRRQEEQAQQAEEQQARTRAEAEYRESLVGALKGSAQSHVKALASDPEEGSTFSQFVFQKVADHYRETGEELEPDEAAQEIIEEVIRPRLARWNKILGNQAAVMPEAAQAALGAQSTVTTAKASKHVTRHAAKQAGPPGEKLSREEAKKAWLEMGIEEMKKAQQAEDAA